MQRILAKHPKFCSKRKRKRNSILSVYQSIMDFKAPSAKDGVPAGFIRRSDFGKEFIFGSATSAFQIEGASSEDGRGKCIWDTFAKEKNLFSPYGEDAVHHYKHYEEDVKLMKEIGFDAYRFSISWSRILPTGKKASRNQKGIDFYKRLLSKLKENEIEPFVTLLHFDPPQELEDEYRGFLDRRIADDFRDYADICFEEFGEQVKYWITINEPWSFAYGGYVYAIHAPGRGIVKDEISTYALVGNATNISKSHEEEDDSSFFPPSRFSFQTAGKGFRMKRSAPEISLFSGANTFPISKPAIDSMEVEVIDPLAYPYKVAHHQLLAHAKAVDLYKKKYQEKQNGKIGITLVSMWYLTLTDDQKDKEAAERANDFMLGWFMCPLTKGEYPESMRKHVTKGHLPEMEDDKSLIQGSFDFIGLNYYTARYISHAKINGGNYITDQQLKWHDKRDKIPISEVKGGSSWLYAYPKGIMDLLLHMKEKYDNPIIYITENGIDDLDDDSSKSSESLCDEKRKSYLHDHLSFVKQAKGKKVNVEGYFVWSFLDNFEWDGGFKYRFGITYVDYKDGGKRYPKLSAKWLKSLLEN